MEDDTNAEQVANRVVFGLQVLKVDYFWGHVAWSAAPDKKIRLCKWRLSKTEVGDNAIVIILFSQKNIFWLQISMHDFLFMHDLQAFQNSFHDCFNLMRTEFMPIFDLVVELPALEQFNPDVNRILRLEDAIKFH